MASGKARCTRKLRSWIVEQVESGQFPGVCWDDDAKTMFRIPWKHAGKQDFREEDAAIFKVRGPAATISSRKGAVPALLRVFISKYFFSVVVLDKGNTRKQKQLCHCRATVETF